jgi:hypothetical protein
VAINILESGGNPSQEKKTVSKFYLGEEKKSTDRSKNVNYKPSDCKL